jgi:Ca2+-binding RTX toxin-like protein
VLPGSIITLTTGIDIKTGTSGADTFDGSVNANGVATLTSVDNLDGAGGNDLLLGGLAGGNLAPTLKNIESAEFITALPTTFDLVNTTGLNSMLMRNSSAALTVNNIPSTTGTTFTIQDQAADVNLNFTNSALVGANSFTLALSGAQSDATGGADVTIAQQAGTDTSGLETVTLTSGGSAANFLDSLAAQNAAATSTLATLNVTGAQGLTVTTGLAASVRTVDASGMTGANGLTAPFAATAAVTVTGSGGDDALTFTANNADSTINAGAGNDVISITNFNTNDSIAGGDGTADRLDITAVNAEAIAANLTNTTGFEQLSLNTAGSGGATLNATRFGSIDTVRLNKGTAGAYTVTLAAGTQTLGIAEPTAGTNATLGGLLTVNDTGTATTDVLNITNRDTDTTSATNNFAGAAITVNGFETVNLNTGSVATVAQTTGVITLNNDSLSGANTLNVSGANGVTVARVDSNSSGLLTIDASGLTGTAALTMTAAPVYTVSTGTTKITGSANADTLLGIAAASGSTIVGGAGNDTITGGSQADSITGDAGNDTISGAAGNDTISGGDGNDTIDVSGGAGTVSLDGGAGNDTVNLAATLTASDVVVGGEGTDTLRISAAATAATAAGVSGFETLSLDAAVAQGMEQFTNNTGFTQINYNAAATIAVTNAAAAVTAIQVDTSGANVYSLGRLVDTTSNSLTITPETGGPRTVATLTIDNEESVTINTGTKAGDNLTITTLNAADLTTLTVSGSNNVTITNPIGAAANLATISAAGLTGTLSVDASTSTANGTFTGSFSAANTITGGTGADTITGGTAADSLTGGNGADVIDGGAGADTLLGGLGNDSISGGIGDDTITGGVGNDTLAGGDGADDFVFEAASNGVDRITGFVSGTDDLNVITNGLLAAIAGETPITAAGAADSVIFADDNVYYVSMNGAAANLTTLGTATLSADDLTATTLTNLATYLDERFATSATNGHDVVLAINWTAGSSTTTYLYEHVEANANATIQAAELALIGIIDRGTTILTANDVI